MDRNGQAVTRIDLGYEQMLILEAGRDGRMRVLHGGDWLAGGEAPARHRPGSRPAGRLPAAAPPPIAGPAAAGRRAAPLPGRVLQALRQWVTRLQLGPLPGHGEPSLGEPACAANRPW